MKVIHQHDINPAMASATSNSGLVIIGKILPHSYGAASLEN